MVPKGTKRVGHNPSGASLQPDLIPAGASIQQNLIPRGASLQPDLIPSGASFPLMVPKGTKRVGHNPSGASLQPDLIPAAASIQPYLIHYIRIVRVPPF